ncbi:MAG: flagellar hook-length control protein FliK [Fimbriimonadaceae bacterium]|nr:flagellar hook-length control protein FliK [Fimbriimonadaceae bacterium]
MKVFALTLQTGPGTDAPANREPVSEGFSQTLSQAEESLSKPVSIEEESATPDVPTEENLDLKALDAVNALSLVGMNPVTGLVIASIASLVAPSDGSPAPSGQRVSAIGTPLASDQTFPVSALEPQGTSTNPELTSPEQLILKSVEVSQPQGMTSQAATETVGNKLVTQTRQGHGAVQPEVAAPEVINSSEAKVDRHAIRITPQGETSSPEAVGFEATRSSDLEGENPSDGERNFDDGSRELPAQSGIHRPQQTQAEGFSASLDKSTGVRDALRSIADRIVNTVELKPQGEVKIVLDSIDLGAITTTVQIDGPRVDAQIKVQDERLGMAMHAQRQELFHRIEARGLSLDSFHVGQENSLSSSHQQASSEQFREGQQRGQLIAANSSLEVADTTHTGSDWSPTTRWINTIA